MDELVSEVEALARKVIDAAIDLDSYLTRVLALAMRDDLTDEDWRELVRLKRILEEMDVSFEVAGTTAEGIVRRHDRRQPIAGR